MKSLNRTIIIAATGHRPPKLGGYGPRVYADLVKLAEDYLYEYAGESVRGISGMALGWDQAFAEACVGAGIPYIAAVPFKGMSSAWPEAAQRRYDRLLRAAAEVVYVCVPGYAVWKMQKRNEWMVDNCTRLCALWDGSSGGTANCLRYAEKVRGRTGAPFVDNLWNRWDR